MERHHYDKSVFTSLQIADALFAPLPTSEKFSKRRGYGKIGGSVSRSEREMERKYQKYLPQTATTIRFYRLRSNVNPVLWSTITRSKVIAFTLIRSTILRPTQNFFWNNYFYIINVYKNCFYSFSL